MDADFPRQLQRRYDGMWPPHARQAIAKVPDRRAAPPLHVVVADPGTLPACAQEKPVLYVHLAGLLRSFSNVTAHLQDFLESGATCWFVFLFTLSHAEQRAPWWCSVDHRGSRAERSRCLEHAAAGANTSVVHTVPRLLEGLRRARNGGAAYAVVARHHEPPLVDTAVLQNFAAVSTLARCTLSHHQLATRPTDLILHSRPDVIYSSALDFPRMEAFSRRAQPLLLLLRHGSKPGAEGINWNDPSDITWLASRSALDRLCPDSQPCLGAQSAEELRRRYGNCGHAYVGLFIHAASSLGIASFFVPVGWRISLLRSHGDIHRRYNGGSNDTHTHAAGNPVTWRAGPVHSEAATHSRSVPWALGPPRDLTAGLRCATGFNERNESACAKSTATLARTPWGMAKLSAAFGYGARYFVCAETYSL